MHPRLLTALLALAAVALFAPSAGANTAPKLTNNYYVTCLINDAGSVLCTGSNQYYQMGTTAAGDVTQFTPVPGVSGATDVVAGEEHVCAVVGGGQVLCWGSNSSRQLGRNDTVTSRSEVPAPVVVDGGAPLTGAIEVSSQEYFTCARREDATVWCWGANGDGQLGNGDDVASAVAVQVVGLTDVKKVSVGVSSACAVKNDQTVWCWGSDSYGKLGNGADGSSYSPVKVVGADGAVDVGTADSTACAVISDGTVRCWGSDSSGALGNGGDEVNSDTAVPTAGLTGAARIAPGYSSLCALTVSRQVFCWGYNSDYRILDETTSDITVPTERTTLAGAAALVNSYESATCVMFRGGAVRCGGRNSYGQIGVSPVADKLTATDAAGVDLVTQPWPAAAASLAAVGKPKLDRKKKNYTVTTAATIKPDLYVLPAEACTGTAKASAVYTYYVKKKVKVKVRGKKKTKIKKVKKQKTYKATGALSLTGEDCTSSIALKLPVKQFAGKKVKVTQTTVANGSMLATTSSKTVKLAKVKTKKKKK